MGTVTKMELRKVDELRPYENNAKLHPTEQIEKLRKSFREFGMIVPIGIDSQDRVIYGHGRLMAAKAEGWTEVPTVTVEDLTDEQRAAFVHADNLLGETGYDKETLLSEARALHAAGFDVSIVGFDAAGIDLAEIVTTLSPPPTYGGRLRAGAAGRTGRAAWPALAAWRARAYVRGQHEPGGYGEAHGRRKASPGLYRSALRCSDR